MSEISVGVIGAGGIAQVAHLPVASRIDGVKVIALCDSDINKANSLASRFGVPDTYDDIEDLLKSSKPDAVVVCTPNHLHEVHALTALSVGTHVLCERPLATSAAGVQRMITAMASYDKVLMVVMNSRYRNDSQAVRQFLERGELGTLKSIRGGSYFFRPSRNALGWRLSREKAGGGVMLDLGLSLIDLALWLARDAQPVRVSATYNWDETESEIEDNGCALITCDTGISVFVDVSWRYLGASERFWFELLGDRGSAALSPLRVFAELHGNPVDVSPSGAIGSENQFLASYRAQWANFLAAVRGNVTVPPLDEQLLAHRVLEAANLSAVEGREVVIGGD